MRKSRILEKLRAGKPALSVNISLAPSPLAVELVGHCGFDGIWIDTEHRPMNEWHVAPMITAGRCVDVDCFVRIRKGEGYSSFFRPLEDGAAGIMVPHVKTREEAEWVVRNAKFPPIGRRGMETMMPDADLGFTDPVAYTEHANRETFVCIQIEDVEALDHIDEIAATPGLDILFIGPADLTFSMGIPLHLDHPRYREAVKAIASAAEKSGKWWGVPVGDFETAGRYLDQGARFLNVAGDYGILRNGLLNAYETFSALSDRV